MGMKVEIRKTSGAISVTLLMVRSLLSWPYPPYVHPSAYDNRIMPAAGPEGPLGDRLGADGTGPGLLFGTKQVSGGLEAALLVLVVGEGGSFLDFIAGLVREPAGNGGLQRVRLRSHETGGQEDGSGPQLRQARLKIGLALAREDHGGPWLRLLLERGRLDVEIHQAVMADVDDETGAALQRDRLLLELQGRRVVAARRGEEIQDRLFDLVATIGVGHKIRTSLLVLENDSL